VPTSYSSRRKWGVSWQITPRVLTEALAAGGDKAKRAFDAVMGIKKIDIAAIEAARLKTGSDRLLTRSRPKPVDVVRMSYLDP